MDEKRMQEIALAMMRVEIRRREIRLNANFRRELGNIAKKLEAFGVKVATNELASFFRVLVQEALDEAFAEEKT